MEVEDDFEEIIDDPLLGIGSALVDEES